MLEIASKVIKLSTSSGFINFSFRYSSPDAIYLYEVNPGLVGDGLIDVTLSEHYPDIDFYEIEVSSMLHMTSISSLMQLLPVDKNNE